MIERQLREAFARHEHPVPDVESLRKAIDEAATRRRRRRRAVGASAAGLAVLAAVSAPVLGRAIMAARAPEAGTASSPNSAVGDAPLNFLVLGLDRRGDMSDSRADTILVVHVPHTRDRAYLISVPRDTRADVPGVGVEKINGAYAHGGVALVARTLEKLSGGLSFDGAATVEFSALREVTDAVGGVRLCVERKVVSSHTGRVFEPGCRDFDGAQALDYLRQRKDLPDGALGRDDHTQDYLRALVAKVHATDLLSNPGRLDGALRAAGAGLVVDTRGRELAELIWELRAIGAGDLIGVRLPVRADPGSAGFFTPDPALAPGLFDAVRHDDMAAWLSRHPQVRQR
jgi:LCP family protein required for cell wall assembly